MSDSLGPLRSLGTAALGLAKRTTSGRMALARVAAVADPAMLPPQLREVGTKELASWKQTPEPQSAADVEKQLRGAWGEKPSKLLDDFDPEPVAVTVSSQVHRGSYDGEPVAIKLLKPGLTAIVRADLDAAEALAGPMRGALPGTDFGALLAEVRERVLDELDLEHEGSSQRTLSRALRGVDGVQIPLAVSDLTHHDVLVRAWVEGEPLGPGADPVHAATLVTALATAARAGVVYADVEADNVLVMSDGTLALIDAGAVARTDRERGALLGGALTSLGAGDHEAVASVLVELGWFDDAAAAAQAAALGHDLGAPLLSGPATLDLDVLGSMAGEGYARLAEAAALARHVTVVPSDLGGLRMMGTATATLALLGATEDWPALVAGALETA